jgi:hypothetical protein
MSINSRRGGEGENRFLPNLSLPDLDSLPFIAWLISISSISTSHLYLVYLWSLCAIYRVQYRPIVLLQTWKQKNLRFDPCKKLSELGRRFSIFKWTQS